MVVKQFAVDRPDAHPLPDTAPLHYYNPFYLRLDLKTHSTRLLHNSIQQTSVDATPEYGYVVSSGPQTDVAPPPPPSSRSSSAASTTPPPPARVTDRRSCSVASVKKSVAFADKVDVCGGCDDGDGDGDDPAAPRSRANVLQVHSQTGEVVGDVLIERKRGPVAAAAAAAAAGSPAASTPSSADEDATGPPSAGDRRRRHEMFCRRRQSPVYSCNDDGPPAAESSPSSSSSSASVYESCDDLPVVVLGVERGRSATAVHGYASCCSL